MDLQDMTDRVCMVTGANAGIGKATARGLADLGARVVMVCRNEARGGDARTDIQQATGNAEVDLLIADLAVQDEIRDLADTVHSRYDRLDVLINNAGVYNDTRETTPDGIEVTFAVNHLAYFLLTHLLLDLLKRTADEHGEARTINVSSEAHRGVKIDLDDINSDDGYSGLQAYGQSKLANVLFTYELDQHLQGTDVTVNAVHPGVVATNIWKNNSDWISRFARLFTWFYKSPEQGAEGSLYLAASPDVKGVSGRYFKGTAPAKSSPASYSEKAARRLWNLSLEMTGLDASANQVL